MADIVLRQDGQLPAATRVRYKDMGNGTHALVFATNNPGNPGNLVVSGTLVVELARPESEPRKVVAPVSFNVVLKDKNTEYTLVLPADTELFEIQCRTKKNVRFAFQSGKVAGRVVPYHTLQPGAPYVSPRPVWVNVLYFATSAQNVVVEVLAWV